MNSYERKLKDKIDSLILRVVSGKCADFIEYKALTKEIAAFEESGKIYREYLKEKDND